MATAQKTERFDARMTEDQDRLIRQAAAVVGASRTEFVLDAAVNKAQQILAEHRILRVPLELAEQFYAYLDAPAEPIAAMKGLADLEPFPER